MPEQLPQVTVADAAGWRRWLAANWGSAGAWLVLAKKGVTEPTRLAYGDALEEALCFGWIDGQVRRHDATTYLQRFTPRGPRSAWSPGNVRLAERLTAEGRIHAAGAAAIERAKAQGRWTVAATNRPVTG